MAQLGKKLCAFLHEAAFTSFLPLRVIPKMKVPNVLEQTFVQVAVFRNDDCSPRHKRELEEREENRHINNIIQKLKLLERL
jgi:hypothetical protein